MDTFILKKREWIYHMDTFILRENGDVLVDLF